MHRSIEVTECLLPSISYLLLNLTAFQTLFSVSAVLVILNGQLVEL